MEKVKDWDLFIKPTSSWFDLKLQEIWRYRDLLLLFVKRDFVSIYKQTILGPLWLVLQPVVTTLTFTIIFTKVAKIGTNNIPPVLFYMAGVTLWSYFSDCLLKTSNTFITNATIFGKVYFPRLIVPLSVLLSSLIKFGVQFLMFFCIWIYYCVSSDFIHPGAEIVVVPFLVFLLALYGLSLGLIISSLTTKYRDLTFLVSFGIQLLMYASPIVYPLSIVPSEYKSILLLNPLTSIIETFKVAFLGTGYFSWGYLIYSSVLIFVLFFVGIVVFKKVERTFMDTV